MSPSTEDEDIQRIKDSHDISSQADTYKPQVLVDIIASKVKADSWILPVSILHRNA